MVLLSVPMTDINNKIIFTELFINQNNILIMAIHLKFKSFIQVLYHPFLSTSIDFVTIVIFILNISSISFFMFELFISI